MFSRITPFAPRFSGAYLNRKDAERTTSDLTPAGKKDVLELTCMLSPPDKADCAGYLYINNDSFARDLDQFQELTRYMRGYDKGYPINRQRYTTYEDAVLLANWAAYRWNLASFHQTAEAQARLEEQPD